MAHPPRLSVPLALDDLLLYRLNNLLGTAGGMVIRLCEGRFGITRREWRVLAVLAQREGLLSSQLASRAQLDRARTSRAVTSLVSKNMVRREALPDDRRQAALCLTPRGRELFETMFPLVLALNRQLLAAITPEQVSQLDAVLDALQVRAEELVAETVLPKANRRRGDQPRPATG
jgi:DNA-binding MarR family transcriptional regulator